MGICEADKWKRAEFFMACARTEERKEHAETGGVVARAVRVNGLVRKREEAPGVKSCNRSPEA